uniref:Uncharacterized protein n=1 Tax=Solanum tuberosum TaxID=4113 RepID=M1C4Q6_SOLTU
MTTIYFKIDRLEKVYPFTTKIYSDVIVSFKIKKLCNIGHLNCFYFILEIERIITLTVGLLPN